MPDPEKNINSEINIETPELENVGIREYMKYFFPDLDEKILDNYEYIEQNCPDKLLSTHSDEDEIPIDKYTAIHSQIHEQMAKQILGKSWNVLVEESGMFGGKTSLSYKLLDMLETQGYSVKIFIADAMGEDFVTARSYRNGSKKREAQRYGKMFPNIKLPPKEYYVRSEDGKLRKVHNEKRVVLLDEFSFLDEKSIKKFVQKCKKENVKVILTGLNRNYLGEKLPPFRNLHKLIGNHKRVECKSFIPGIDNDEPTGTHTVRYIKLGNKEIIDLGVLPDVVSKEEVNKSGGKIVHYTPGREDMTFKYIFRNYPDILEYILNPTEEQKEKREKRFNILKDR